MTDDVHSQDIEPYEPDPWERQPREPEKAWRAFRRFRETPMGERTISRVARELGTSRQNIDVMATKWHWRDRIEAYDRETDRRELAELAEARRAANERHRGAAAIAHSIGARWMMEHRESADGLDAQDAAMLMREGFREERTVLGLSTDLVRAGDVITIREAARIINEMTAIFLEQIPTEQHELVLARVRAVAASS